MVTESPAPSGNDRILVLDSGVGGLSVLNEIRTLLPTLPVDYIADHKFFPYGSKTQTQLNDRVSLLIESMVQRAAENGYGYRLAVIACNTASTVVLDNLRASFSLPFVGVVPAIKPACINSNNKRVGLLATEGTVTREYTHGLIRSFAADHQLTLVGSAELVTLAEQKLSGNILDIQTLVSILKPFKEANVDTIVLGCTHFPLVKEELKAAADWPVKWVDSGKAIAQRVEYLLSEDPLKSFSENDQAGSVVFFSTDMSLVSFSEETLQAFSRLESLTV